MSKKIMDLCMIGFTHIGGEMINRIICLMALVTSVTATEIYIDIEDFGNFERDMFIYQNDNEWIKIKNLRSNEHGIYILQEDIVKDGEKYESYWKCPYCHRYWRKGERCQNTDCPSRYM